MVNFEAKNLILFTGAGFTKNFGGFLGDEMWAQIFNDTEVRTSKNLRKLLQYDYDFESVYSAVVSGNYSEDDKNIIRRVIERAYRRLDDATKNWVFNHDSPYPVNWYGWSELTNLFTGRGNEKGLFFTLNQDIFLERRSRFLCPGAPPFRREFYDGPGRDLNQEDFVVLPNENAVERAERDFMNHTGLSYIKLHGSYGWKSSDGSNQMVIGKNKAELIENEPLLKWYFELFKSVIERGDKKILIVGYGFGDQHINKILVDGVVNHNLQIFIINPTSPEKFRRHFEQGGHFYALPILDGLYGYFPWSLLEIFPGNQERTEQLRQIREALSAT
jgi:hypothetical protein